jgi:NAD-dependent SIR2 family protein deacetylase
VAGKYKKLNKLFNNQYYGNVMVNKIPVFKQRKEEKYTKINDDKKNLIEQKIKSLNFNKCISTVRGKLHQKKLLVCNVDKCSRKIGYTNKKSLINHLLLIHKKNIDEAKQIANEILDKSLVVFMRKK